MISLLLALAVSATTEHQLLKPIEWVQQQVDTNTILKSYVPLSSRKVRLIKSEIEATHRKFDQFYGRCNPGPLEIRVIRLKWLNSSEYFVWTDPKYVVLGRYFSMRNVLYITPETFTDLYTLEHELTHYLYDECNIRFDDEEQEHLALDRFIRWARQ